MVPSCAPASHFCPASRIVIFVGAFITPLAKAVIASLRQALACETVGKGLADAPPLSGRPDAGLVAGPTPAGAAALAGGARAGMAGFDALV
jgi:hypothetical protein